AKDHEAMGIFTIKSGAMFSPALQNKSSVDFKILAFDVQQMVDDMLHASELQNEYKGSKVTQFRNGSVIVFFKLFFVQWVSEVKIKNALVYGIKENKSELLQTLTIDVNSIEIIDLGIFTTSSSLTTSGLEIFSTTTPGLGITSTTSNPSTTPGLGITSTTSNLSTTPGKCLPLDGLCADDITCIRKELFCDGIPHCPDGSDENKCAQTSGSNPGTVYIFSDKATVEFVTDLNKNLNGFNATYTAFNASELTNNEKINCTFEDGFCYWIQHIKDRTEWERTDGPVFPTTGPDFDHTFGNLSGYYVLTLTYRTSEQLRIEMFSLPLDPISDAYCLSFWYYMYGIKIYRLNVKIIYDDNNEKIIFQKEGNYGNIWNYGQITLNETSKFKVAFEALKRYYWNDIALDDIGLSNGACAKSIYPEPTLVPTIPTTFLLPTDCGGPYDLWEPNTTFTSMNYPNNYPSKASCVWYLNAEKGKNIQLHFQYFNLEDIYDVVEVRDGRGAESLFLGKYIKYINMYEKIILN
ncbi:hypothetical protein Chor_000420, partial [Crotalus horridus]